ncbi:DUF6090 family protein [Lutimonas vermicola]|uniref:DUF6090 family protein n=2 Tax=Lutimonas vermicola TaxID=414288 RepID=A0ABU9L293_9FLAO
MADDNKPLKYMRYAVGEIVLVVIGILIALQINNWNEMRKLQNTMKSIYSIIKTDLQSDVKNIDLVIAEMAPRDSIFKRVINNDMTKDDYLNCENCCFILYGFPDITLNMRGVKLLEDNGAVFDSHQDSLSIEISNFYAYFNTEIGVAVEEVNIDFEDNYSYFKNNKAWFKDYIKKVKSDELIIYQLTSSDYINRVSSFYMLYYENYQGESYLEHLRNYKENALFLIEKINKKIK